MIQHALKLVSALMSLTRLSIICLAKSLEEGGQRLMVSEANLNMQP